MKFVGIFSCLLSIHFAAVVDGIFLKHLTPRPGGIIDTLTKPKIPGFQFGSQLGGGLSLGVGSFGFNFGFNKQYVPGGTYLPPKDPHVPEGKPIGNPYDPEVKPDYPDEKPYVPGVKPEYPDEKPYVPGVKPGYPDEKPYVPGVKPGVKPEVPEVTWEEEEEKIPQYPRPNRNKGDSKPESFEDGYGNDKGHPKREDTDFKPDWEDIGEYPEDAKSENFMNSDLTGAGLIQPRQNKRRSKRFIESRVYHVPLVFRSNAKPYQVKIQSNLNSLMKKDAEK